MRVENTAPIILDACINFLKDRPTNTKYHPKEGVYIIDTITMARIIWHEGNLRAEVNQDETRLCNHFIKALIEQKNVKSVMTSHKYNITEKYDLQRKAMIVKKRKLLNLYKDNDRVTESIKKGVEAENG